MTQSIDCRSTKELIQISCQMIMEEELETSSDGKVVSHLEIYLESMYENSCNMRPFLNFIESLERGLTYKEAVEASSFNSAIKRYFLILLCY